MARSSSTRRTRSTWKIPWRSSRCSDRAPSSTSESWSRLLRSGRAWSGSTTPSPKSPAGPERSSPPASSVRRLPPGLRGTELQRLQVDARARLDVDEVGDLHLETARDRQQHVERRVPPRPLDLGEVPERQPDPVRCVRLGPSEAPSRALDACCDTVAKRLGAHPETRPQGASSTLPTLVAYV